MNTQSDLSQLNIVDDIISKLLYKELTDGEIKIKKW